MARPRTQKPQVKIGFTQKTTAAPPTQTYIWIICGVTINVIVISLLIYCLIKLWKCKRGRGASPPSSTQKTSVNLASNSTSASDSLKNNPNEKTTGSVASAQPTKELAPEVVSSLNQRLANIDTDSASLFPPIVNDLQHLLEDEVLHMSELKQELNICAKPLSKAMTVWLDSAAMADVVNRHALITCLEILETFHGQDLEDRSAIVVAYLAALEKVLHTIRRNRIDNYGSNEDTMKELLYSICRHIETVTVDSKTSAAIVKPKQRLSNALKSIVELELHTDRRNVDFYKLLLTILRNISETRIGAHQCLAENAIYIELIEPAYYKKYDQVIFGLYNKIIGNMVKNKVI